MQDQRTPRATIALFMLVAALGGFAFQIPVGRLSDRFDRRIVLAFLGLGFAGTAFVMVLLASLPADDPASRGLARRIHVNTVTPVCVAHAHDRMPGRSGRGGKRTAHLGERGWFGAPGPLIGASLMARFEIGGVFYFMAAAAYPAGARGRFRKF